MTRNHLGWIALIALLTLAACGGETSSSVARPTLPTVAPASTATPAASFASLTGVPGVLIYAEGDALYTYPPGASEPVRLADAVDLNSLTLSPRGEGLIFAAQVLESEGLSADPRAVSYVDLARLTPTVILDGSGEITVVGWSPDGAWVLLRAGWADLIAARLDGSQQHALGSLSSVEARWLADSSLLLTDRRLVGSGMDYAYQQVARFDPRTGQTEALPVDLAALAGDPARLEQALAALGMTYADTEVQTGPQPVLMRSEEGTGVCDTWHIGYGENAEGAPPVVYSGANVYRLSVPTPLPDGSLLFLETRVPRCDIANAPVTRLMRLPPGGEVQVLAEDVSEGPHENTFLAAFAPARSYAAAPGGRYVVWIGGGMLAGWSSLELLDLATQVHTRLAYKAGGDTSTSFTEKDLYNVVLWGGS